LTGTLGALTWRYVDEIAEGANRSALADRSGLGVKTKARLSALVLTFATHSKALDADIFAAKRIFGTSRA